MRHLIIGATAALTITPALGAETPSVDELYQIIQAQQEQIDRLADKRDNGGNSATSIGGYGELHYNSLDSGKQLDFHRFVLFVGHEFSDDIRFYSELELEHAFIEDESECEFTVPAGGFVPGQDVECEGESSHGEVELEQAYVEFDLDDSMQATGGVFLLPIGLMNETHEPNTFYGVERNPVEKNIIPATWWEGGAKLSGNFGASGVSYDLGVHSGLNVGDGFSVRDGRQKVSEGIAEELAYSGRLKYTGIAGLEVAASFFHQGDISQGMVAQAGAATLLETHVRWNSGPLTLTALYADWNIDGAAAELLEKDSQDGYYGEASWKFSESFGVFARHNVWDNGGIGDTEKTQTNFGINYWPHRNVVVKFDLQRQGKTIDDEGFNLGIGYQF